MGKGTCGSVSACGSACSKPLGHDMGHRHDGRGFQMGWPQSKDERIAALEAKLAEAERENARLQRESADYANRLDDWRLRAGVLARAAEGFTESVASASAAIAARGAGGQQVPYHGDFASAPPSTMGRLRWWANVMTGALALPGAEGREGEACSDCGETGCRQFHPALCGSCGGAVHLRGQPLGGCCCAKGGDNA